jgi:hypothetical protein
MLIPHNDGHKRNGASVKVPHNLFGLRTDEILRPTAPTGRRCAPTADSCHPEAKPKDLVVEWTVV